jgi:hypothetical protein
MSRGEIQRPPIVIVANTIIFIYSTVVITLLGTHAAPPSGLNCSLHERWQKLFHNKDRDAIKTIQDAFNCCGFANSHDMAWPFPDKTHSIHACETTFNRNRGCSDAWKAEEQQTAGLLIVVVGLVFIWQAHAPTYVSSLKHHRLTLHSLQSLPSPPRRNLGSTNSHQTASHV